MKSESVQEYLHRLHSDATPPLTFLRFPDRGSLWSCRRGRGSLGVGESRSNVESRGERPLEETLLRLPDILESRIRPSESVGKQQKQCNSKSITTTSSQTGDKSLRGLDGPNNVYFYQDKSDG